MVHGNTRILSVMSGTRVLKVHVEAVLDAIPTAILAMAAADGNRIIFSQVLAEAAITAADSKTRYCVTIFTPSKERWVFGPYATYKAAEKAIAIGLPMVVPGSGARIDPLIPSPKDMDAFTKQKGNTNG